MFTSTFRNGLLVAMAVLAVVALTIAMGSPSPPLDSAQVDLGRVMYAPCEREVLNCDRAFIKFRGNNQIYRIDSCGEFCQDANVSFDRLRLMARSDSFLASIEKLVLPAAGEEWDRLAVQHQRQYFQTEH